jgi:hypothetical protein
VDSHQYVAYGVCHGIGVGNGRPFAIFEHDDGQVQILWLDGAYRITINTLEKGK